MSSACARISLLLRTVATCFARHDSPLARQMVDVMSLGVSGEPRFGAAQVPASGLYALLSSGLETELAQSLSVCSGDLHWKAPGFGKLPPTISTRLAVAEVIGPLGLFPSEDFRFGLLIQQSHTTYPSHRHAAEEVYLVLQGAALWTAGDNAAQLNPPGQFVHHLPHQPHSMTTLDHPMLAAWIWGGDIRSGSYSA